MTRKWLPFNLNYHVKVKLTDKGMEVMRRNHDQIMGGMGSRYPFHDPRDADGWAEFQLWRLMQEFGAGTSMGSKVDFDTNMFFEKVKA